MVSQRNAYFGMCCIGFFEISVWILMIISMCEIITKPNMEFNIDNIDWNINICHQYQKRYLRKCLKMSNHLLPISATLMCLGTFFCCFLCKPPYGLSIGIILRYYIDIYSYSQIRIIHIYIYIYIYIDIHLPLQ